MIKYDNLRNAADVNDESNASLNRGNIWNNAIHFQILFDDQRVVVARTMQFHLYLYWCSEYANVDHDWLGHEINWDSIHQAGFSFPTDESTGFRKEQQTAVVVRHADERLSSIFIDGKCDGREFDSTSYPLSPTTNWAPQALNARDKQNRASTMNGSCSGVQQWLKEVAPSVVYVYGYEHTFNLAHVVWRVQWYCLLAESFVCIHVSLQGTVQLSYWIAGGAPLQWARTGSDSIRIHCLHTD